MNRLAIFVNLMATVPLVSAPCQTGVCANPVAVTTVIPTVAIPLYGTSYVGAETDTETKELLRQLLKEFQALRADLAKGGNTPSPTGDGPPVPPLKTIDVAAVLTKNCASCHGEKVADEKGGGFTLTNEAGQFLKLPPVARRELVKRVNAGTMPPPKAGTLTISEKQAIEKAMSDVPVIPPAKK